MDMMATTFDIACSFQGGRVHSVPQDVADPAR
jgi:hypothetical protein